MVGWSGRRKNLTILAFILPTLLGVAVFNIYPMLYNVFISFTNRNQFHPNPNCTDSLSGILEPSCWAFTGATPQQGLATPFHVISPLLDNYATLMGKLISPSSLTSMLLILAWFVPLLGASWLNRREGRKLQRDIPSNVIWLAGLTLFVGLFLLLQVSKNMNNLVGTGDFFAVIFRTVLYVVVCLPLFFIVGLTLALILNTPNLRGRTFFRVALILPWGVSTSAIIAATVWQFFFRQQGTINQFIQALISTYKPVAFLNETFWAFFAVTVVNLWMSYPFFMVTILGALQSVPKETYEAADVDGAGWWRKLISITLPMIRPAIMPAIVLSSISTFQMFGTVWAITQGGPVLGAGKPGATEFVMVYAYKQVFQTRAYGLMGAFAVIIFILLFAATLYSSVIGCTRSIWPVCLCRWSGTRPITAPCCSRGHSYSG
jgi:arabinogalactan oligomer / maltooligosaccharide transport system permease protein